MPLLFSVGEQSSLEAVGAQLRRVEHLLAFLDGIYTITRPERVGAADKGQHPHSWCQDENLEPSWSDRLHATFWSGLRY